MGERLSWPGWLTYSRRFTHTSGHPSATGRAQDRESSPAKDRRSTTVPRNQLVASLLKIFSSEIHILTQLSIHRSLQGEDFWLHRNSVAQDTMPQSALCLIGYKHGLWFITKYCDQSVCMYVCLTTCIS